MADTDVDPAVRIVVRPSQLSYFTGEPFSVTITFTNMRSSEPGPSSRALSHPHTHSTMPTPSALLQFPTLRHCPGRPARRAPLCPLRPPAPCETAHQAEKGSLADHRLAYLAPWQLARKHSVADGTAVQLHEIVASPTSPGAYTPSASHSTFSLTLDPIAESSLPTHSRLARHTDPSGAILVTPARRTSTATATRQSDLKRAHPPAAPLPIPLRMGTGAHSAHRASLMRRAVLAPLAVDRTNTAHWWSNPIYETACAGDLDTASTRVGAAVVGFKTAGQSDRRGAEYTSGAGGHGVPVERPSS
ncbi:hypothetical protein B0H11DRAFT_2430909 [Mycena galericulata]|nr:hypothetical protein B0H11DRAFT_2430909 [Mycena galericulata]